MENNNLEQSGTIWGIFIVMALSLIGLLVPVF
jgi:hypothetical protein